jgi:hypothetical protein
MVGLGSGFGGFGDGSHQYKSYFLWSYTTHTPAAYWISTTEAQQRAVCTRLAENQNSDFLKHFEKKN